MHTEETEVFNLANRCLGTSSLDAETSKLPGPHPRRFREVRAIPGARSGDDLRAEEIWHYFSGPRVPAFAFAAGRRNGALVDFWDSGAGDRDEREKGMVV